MPTGFVVRKNEYFDSVFLMGINKRLMAMPGVEQTAVLMATEANKRLLADIGVTGGEIETAQANDLVVAVVGESDEIIAKVIGSFDSILKDMATGTRTSDVHTLGAAFDLVPEANLAVFSIPGEFIAHETHKALDLGLHVFIFSSNVPLQEELELKQKARDRDLLVMGPDCGTSILNGVGIGFANVIRRGSIGVVGPSGTGLQEFTSQVHNAGGGISHAIGTGSHDLSDTIGGLTTVAGLRRLEANPDTEVIAIVAKPPGEETLAKLERETDQFTKPLIGCFLGVKNEADRESSKFLWTSTIDEAAIQALSSVGIQPGESKDAARYSSKVLETIKMSWSPEARYIRGIFAGGTFCFQAQHILQQAGVATYSNGPINMNYRLDDPNVSHEHSMVDMGDEYFTLGKPHPMIDGTERGKRILREAADLNVAILLLDFILGYNASSDPVGELLNPLQEAQAIHQKLGGELTIVASVCGTKDDPQDMDLQIKMLEENGINVFTSSAQAVQFCYQLLEVGRD